jgi:hypothetical protein
VRLELERQLWWRRFSEKYRQRRVILIGRGQCLEQYGAGEAYLPMLDALAKLSTQQLGKIVVEHSSYGRLMGGPATWGFLFCRTSNLISINLFT